LDAARPGADLRIALLPFLKTKTQYTALTMWPVWARDFGFFVLKTLIFSFSSPARLNVFSYLT
jgi:hypothetical protein